MFAFESKKWKERSEFTSGLFLFASGKSECGYSRAFGLGVAYEFMSFGREPFRKLLLFGEFVVKCLHFSMYAG